MTPFIIILRRSNSFKIKEKLFNYVTEKEESVYDVVETQIT